jgi:hypothetical protein
MQQPFLIYLLFYNFHIYSHTLCGAPLLVGANVAIFLGFNVCQEFALNSLLWGLQAAFSVSSKLSQTCSSALQGFL